jgi:hypothetical protein
MVLGSTWNVKAQAFTRETQSKVLKKKKERAFFT